MRNLPIDYHGENVHEVEENFIHGSFATGVAQANGFTATHAVGAITTADRTVLFPPRMNIAWTAAADEFNSYVTTNAVFLFHQNEPIRFIGRMTPGAAAQLPWELNLFLGCMEDMDTATEMQDAGAGPRADDDMFGFFCVENGGAVYGNSEDLWHCVSSFGALQQITALTAANSLSGQEVRVNTGAGAGDGVEHKFVGEWVPTNLVSGVAGAAPTLMDAEVRFLVDDVLVAKHQMRGAFQITVANAAPMNFGIVGRNITDIADLDVDYLKCTQLRP
jgi:hypothetical protein